MKVPAHILAAKLYAALNAETRITPSNSVLVGYNDFSRAQLGNRVFLHLTINPKTGKNSWLKVPEKDVKLISKEDLLAAEKFDAGKPGEACIDELSRPEAFWEHNSMSWQNFMFFLHLIQDDCYDRHIRSFIYTEKRYEGVFEFQGEILTADQLRGKGESRWETGLINLFDDQFYIQLAKAYYEATGILADQTWIDSTVKPAIHQIYSEELAESAVKFVNLSLRVNDIVSNKRWDEENGPIPNFFVLQGIQWMMEAIHGAFLRYGYQL